MKSLELHRFKSLIDLVTFYSTDQACIDTLIQVRWGDDVVCPYCGKHHCKVGYKGRFVCPFCHNKFSVTVGTIFANTKVSLRKWFMAMYLLSSHKKGISSVQLAKDINVTQKTAWLMLHKIRSLLVQEEKTMSGDIEIDEVYIGGKEYFKHKCKRVSGTQGRSTKTKVPVFGILKRSRTSWVYAITVPQTDRETVLPIIDHICEKNSHLYTDESATYYPLSKMGYYHSVVNHKLGEYAYGKVYTNNIEGFWSHFRRMIVGTYHRPSKHYLQSYLNETVWRWNYRNKSQSHLFYNILVRSIFT